MPRLLRLGRMLFTSILALVFLHLSLHPSAATDLKCADPTQTRMTVNFGSTYTATDWCCPDPYLTFGGNEVNFPNYLSYKDPNGTLYTWLPTCLGCIDSNYAKTCSYAPSGGGTAHHYCCPTGYSCSANAYNTAYCAQTGSAGVYGSAVSYTDATPVADFDLCRFTKDSYGSIVKIGSPCDPRFVCEPRTQSEYKCVTCTDPRVFPAGVCDTFFCPEGSYCPGSWTVDATNITATLMIQNITCPQGNYCPYNSTTPIPCSPGQRCDPGLAFPVDCDEGSYCETGSTMKICPVASYCPRGSSQPIPCGPGFYCDTEGLTWPIPCSMGSFCDTGNTASRCAPGYECPYDSMTAPILCQPPQYCPDGFEASTCFAGAYCRDVITIEMCPVGSYCPAGSTQPIPCDSDEYASDYGSAFCQPCDSKWLTSKKGAKTCTVPSNLLIGIICLGIIIFIGLIVGCVFLVRYCSRWQKAQEEKRAKEAELASQQAEMRQQHVAAMAAKQQMKLQQAAAQYQNAVHMQHVAAEATVKEFETNRTRVKTEVIERLLLDLRTDLKLHYSPLTQDNAALNNNNSSSQQQLQQQLQQYEQFLAQLITSQFDNPGCELFPALNMMVANPHTYPTADFSNSLIGIRPRVIESFPVYQASIVPMPGGDAAQLQSIRVNLMRELLRHVQMWLIKMSNISSPVSGSTITPSSQPFMVQPPAPFSPLNHPQIVAPNQSDLTVHPVAPSVSVQSAQLNSDAPLIVSPSQIYPPEAVQVHVATADTPLPGVPVAS